MPCTGGNGTVGHGCGMDGRLWNGQPGDMTEGRKGDLPPLLCLPALTSGPGARMQDGRMTLTVEPTDIRAEFEDTVYMYSSRLEQDGIHLHYIDNDDDIPEISCDPKRLRQVFLNILDNAAKHGGEGKRIDASMTFEQDAVVVQIRDYGPGIPEDEIPLVKKKFYKGSSQARGTGIGLAVCDEIVELHGGTLTLENAEGGGTLVTVRLPAV